MRKAIIIGNIVKDAVVNTPNNAVNRAVINFVVAANDKRRNPDGSERPPLYVNCAYWRDSNKTAIMDYLKKGTLVCVEGEPSASVYTNKDNVAVPQLRIEVEEIELLSASKPTQS